jgi:isocitrate lyase
MDTPINIKINGGMDFFIKKPHTRLLPYIDLIWASNGKPNFKEERVIPDGSSSLFF